MYAKKKNPLHLPVQRVINTDISSELKNFEHEEEIMLSSTFHNTPHIICLLKMANICVVGKLCAVYVFNL